MFTDIVRSKPVNLKEEDEWLFNKAFNYRFEEPTYEQFDQGLWDCFKGSVIETHCKKFNIFIRILIRRKLLINIDSFIWVTNEYSENYFHWFNDVIPSIYFLKKSGIDSPVLINEKLAKKTFVIPSLNILNINYTIIDTKNVIKFKLAIRPTLTAGEGNQHPLFFPQLNIFFRKKINYDTNAQCKVFIVRNNSKSRNFYPLEQVNRLFEKFGFIIVDTGAMSFAKQLKLFSKCTHLAGVHGAGLTNMLFMKSSSKILEIRRNNDDHNNCYYSMASSLNLEYYYLLASGDSNGASVQEDNFIADLSNLENTLAIFAK